MIRAFLLLLALLCAPAAAQNFPALSGRVVDQANLIPDDREAALVGRLEQLQRQTSRQLVVATVASLDGLEIEDYGYRLGRHWQIGQQGANNGTLLIVAPNERKVRVEVGYGLEGILTDALTSGIVRNDILPRFRENDYPGGIEAGASALIAQLAAPPEAAEARALEAERVRETEGAGEELPWWGSLLLTLFILVLPFTGLLLSWAMGDHLRGGRQRWRRGGGFVSPWGVGTDWGGSSGSSWSSSSWGSGGGSSWGGGGGGGGFSGGGGSFGGGGASGGW